MFSGVSFSKESLGLPAYAYGDIDSKDQLKDVEFIQIKKIDTSNLKVNK